MSSIRVARERTIRLSFLAALLVLSAAWLAAPVSHAAVKGKWSDDVARDQSFSRVLVVGITPDRNQRCRFERALASMMRSADTVVLMSCDLLPAEALLTRESIEAVLGSENIDAVLATSLVDRAWERQEGGTRDSRGDAMFKATDAYYGPYGTVVAVDFQTSAPVTIVKGRVEVTSKLYETQNATVVYTLDTKIRNVETVSGAIVAITAPISDELRKAGLIR